MQCRHLIPALNTWAAQTWYTTARPIATQSPGLGCMDDLRTKRSFDSQTIGSLVCLPYLFEILSMGVCTTRHKQTSGRLVQELNVCTVAVSGKVLNHSAIRAGPWKYVERSGMGGVLTHSPYCLISLRHSWTFYLRMSKLIQCVLGTSF